MAREYPVTSLHLRTFVAFATPTIPHPRLPAPARITKRTQSHFRTLAPNLNRPRRSSPGLPNEPNPISEHSNPGPHPALSRLFSANGTYVLTKSAFLRAALSVGVYQSMDVSAVKTSPTPTLFLPPFLLISYPLGTTNLNLGMRT